MSEKSVLGQMISKFERLRASVVAIEEVNKSETDKYGIIAGIDTGDNMVEIKGMIEKPKLSEKVPSNLPL